MRRRVGDSFSDLGRSQGSLAAHRWNDYGGGRAKSPLYGVWDVESMSIDGQLRPPMLTDTERWRRVVFDWTTITAFQRMDESFTYYRSTLDLKANTLTFTKRADPAWRVLFTLQRPAPDQTHADGRMDGHDLHADLRLKDMKFALTTHQFHWIQDPPGAMIFPGFTVSQR